MDMVASDALLLHSNWGCPRQKHLLHLCGNLQIDLLHQDELKSKHVCVSDLEGYVMVIVLLLESCCQIGKLRDHGYRLVVLTGADGMTLPATCSNFDTRAGQRPSGPPRCRLIHWLYLILPGKWCSIGCLLHPRWEYK